MFVLHHRDALSTGLLNSLKETGSACDKGGKGRHAAHQFELKKFSVQHGRKQQEGGEKCATFSTTDCARNQRC